MGNNVNFVTNIIKSNDEERLVYGWAYVCTLNGKISLDHSQEFIRPEELVKAATKFMLDVRAAKAMHTDSPIGEVVHSLPLTKEISESLGIQTDKEGWIICMKIHDDKIWEMVKSGKLRAFSIGGYAVKETKDDN